MEFFFLDLKIEKERKINRREKTGRKVKALKADIKDLSFSLLIVGTKGK